MTILSSKVAQFVPAVLRAPRTDALVRFPERRVRCDPLGEHSWLVFDEADPEALPIGDIRFVRGAFETHHSDDASAVCFFHDHETAADYFEEYVWALSLGRIPAHDPGHQNHSTQNGTTMSTHSPQPNPQNHDAAGPGVHPDKPSQAEGDDTDTSPDDD